MAPTAEVYAFVSRPDNLPKWAAGLGNFIRSEHGEWFADTPHGRIKFRFAENNPFGVLDHYVCPKPDTEIYVPMRAIPNGEGSEILFTLFRQPGMTDGRFHDDLELVEQDLNRLKQVLERMAEPGR